MAQGNCEHFGTLLEVRKKFFTQATEKLSRYLMSNGPIYVSSKGTFNN